MLEGAISLNGGRGNIANDRECYVAMAKRLMDEAREAFRANHYSYRTEEQYLKWTRRFILFHIKQQLEWLRSLHRREVERGKPGVSLPYAINRKYKKATLEWRWWYLFPARKYVFVRMNMCKRRHHIHRSSLSRAVRIAVDVSARSRLIRLSPPMQWHGCPGIEVRLLERKFHVAVGPRQRREVARRICLYW